VPAAPVLEAPTLKQPEAGLGVADRERRFEEVVIDSKRERAIDLLQPYSSNVEVPRNSRPSIPLRVPADEITVRYELGKELDHESLWGARTRSAA
jgi:hypothetical protein